MNNVMHNPPWPTLSSHALVWAGAAIVLAHHLVAAGLVGTADQGAVSA